MKQSISLILLIFCLTVISQAQQSPVFIANGHAIKGYDAVAFFTNSRPVPGADSLRLEWEGATWLFSTKENLESFRAEPAKYAPQYGGYCAFGTAEGHKAPTQVDTWTIVNGKLYFNYNRKVKEVWMKDQEKLIRKADEQWPTVRNSE